MAAAVSKLMRQDLILVAVSLCEVVTRFRQHLWACGHHHSRAAAANHPSDSCGHAGQHPGRLIDGGGRRRDRYQALRRQAFRDGVVVAPAGRADPAPPGAHASCIADPRHQHLGPQQGAPMTWCSSRGRPQATNSASASAWPLLDETHAAALALAPRPAGRQPHVPETGQGGALSGQQHHGVDQQTLEARAYAVCAAATGQLPEHGGRLHRPRVPCTTASRSFARGWKTTFCGKLKLACPWAATSAHTNHAAEADQDDMDTCWCCCQRRPELHRGRARRGRDAELESTSFHDALFIRQLLGKQRAPEFEAWLQAGHYRRWGLLPLPPRPPWPRPGGCVGWGMSRGQPHHNITPPTADPGRAAASTRLRALRWGGRRQPADGEVLRFAAAREARMRCMPGCWRAG